MHGLPGGGNPRCRPRAAVALAHRNQYWRCPGRRGQPAGRRRQRRRPAGEHRSARRDLQLGQHLRTFRVETLDRVRGHRSSGGEEHPGPGSGFSHSARAGFGDLREGSRRSRPSAGRRQASGSPTRRRHRGPGSAHGRVDRRLAPPFARTATLVGISGERFDRRAAWDYYFVTYCCPAVRRRPPPGPGVARASRFPPALPAPRSSRIVLRASR